MRELSSNVAPLPQGVRSRAGDRVDRFGPACRILRGFDSSMSCSSDCKKRPCRFISACRWSRAVVEVGSVFVEIACVQRSLPTWLRFSHL